MKNFSSDLLALLQRTPGVWPAGTDFSSIARCNLYKIGPCANGAMIYATDLDAPVYYNGNTYEPTKYGSWSRGQIKNNVGFESNTCKLTVATGQQFPIFFPGTTNGCLFLDGIKLGLMDGGQNGRYTQVTIYTVYFATINGVTQWNTTQGPNNGSMVENKFVGELSSIDKLGLTTAEMTVSDLLYLLNAETPQRLVKTGCFWQLYSSSCTLSRASFSRTGSVTALGANNLSFNCAHLAPHTGAGTFTQGSLTWTSGFNNGLTSQIRLWTPGAQDTIMLDVQPIFPMQPGDAFTIAQGCDHTAAACNDFNNIINYSGLDTVPSPETSI